MSILAIIFLALALSIDAAVVSFSQGLVFQNNKRKNSFYLAFAFGLFQTLMPLIGWAFTRSIYHYIEAIDHWIAFGIFLVLGLKIIDQAFKKQDEQKEIVSCISLQYLLILSVATSIDALAAGITLYFVRVNIWIPAILIGIVTFMNSLIGFWAGYVLKRFPTKFLECLSGVILIILGCHILLQEL